MGSVLSKLLDAPAMLNRMQRLLSLGKDANKKWLKGMMEPKAPDLVLDVGCGTGRYAEIFDCHYLGIDSDEGYISYAREKHGGEFLVMDATSLAFPDGTFHYVFSVGLLHHMDDDKAARALGEMRRVCQPGGKIVIIEPIYPTNRFNIIGYILLRLDRGKFMRHLKDLRGILSVDSSGFKYSLEKSFPFEEMLISGVKA